MNRIKGIIVFGIIVVMVFITFINFQKNKKNLDTVKVDNIQYINANSIKDIIKSNKFIILYYTDSDCPSCISLGYEIINKLSEKNNKEEIEFFIISNSEKIVSDSILYNNKIPIKIDNQILIKKTFNYIDTPIIIFSNNNNTDSSIVVKIKNDLFTEQSIKNVAELNKLIY